MGSVREIEECLCTVRHMIIAGEGGIVNCGFGGKFCKDVEEDQRTINEFMPDLNAEYHKRALLDDESVSSDDEESTKIRAFMEIAEDEPSVGKANERSVLGNIVKALGGKDRRKEKNSSKEVIFTKADESSSMIAPEITSDSESECDLHEPLPPLPKLIGAAPSSTSKSLIYLSDLTLNMANLTLNTPEPKRLDHLLKCHLLISLQAPLHQAPSQVVLKLPSKRPGLDPVSTVDLGIISLMIATVTL
uniref:Uncharacterized protein n=1 Tax=Tanacetum cinerariifolium TaxID=118510 RepID=A0A699HNA9_TANCI|nr:hypothetical protein [Tanacetum cinerariifolium]